MKNLFVSYELSLALKEKGFDEDCLAYWQNKILYPCVQEVCTLRNMQKDKNLYPEYNNDDTVFIEFKANSINLSEDDVSAPLYQQVIDWLETKGIFIELIADAWTEDKDITQVTKFPCYRLFIWQVGQPKPKPHHDYGCGERYQMLDIAFEEALKLI